MKYIFIAISLLLASFNIKAFERADELLWACTLDKDSPSPTEYINFANCAGYISGMLDGFQIVFSMTPDSRAFCPPKEGISIDQQIRIVKKSLEDNPSKLHESARTSVFIAFAHAFPCE